MLASLRAAYACVEAFSETDQNEDLKKFDVPTLILQGDDDQIVPIQAAAKKQARLIRNSILKVYPGAPHAMPVTHADQVNRDLLDFIEASSADLTRRAGAETGAAGREAH
jgi:non-heme chloroperoxidase